MKTFNISVIVILLLSLLSLIEGQQASSRLYRFGPDAGDQKLAALDEGSSSEVRLRTPIKYYGREYDNIYVNTNGIVSFLTEIPNFFNIQFPLEYPIIAAFYSDVDISTGGDIWYRETSDPTTVGEITKDLRDYFNAAENFRPTGVFVVTWDHVTGHGVPRGKTNTFQIAIASDGSDSYVALNYDGIQWLQGKGKNPSQSDAIGQAGLLSGDGRMHLIKYSGTDQIRNLPTLSNTGSAGKWLYQVGQIEDNVAEPDTFISQVLVNSMFPASCTDSASLCHSKGRCVDYPGGFCCYCGEGYYGNGMNCIKEDTPVRVTGKVTGNLNGIEISGADLHSYTQTSEGRTYTAISNIPDALGQDIQAISVVAEGIVWLFAKSVSQTKNGFMLSGGNFNRTVAVDFPSTGDYLEINQIFHGLDVFKNIQVTTKISGRVPQIPRGSKVTVRGFSDEFSRINSGSLFSRSIRSITSDQTGEEVEYNVKTTINFDECQFSDDPVAIIKMKVGENVFVQYDKPEKIIRFALTAKVGPLQDEDPCVKGREECGPHSECVAEEDNFRCICDRGYEQFFDPTLDRSLCVDKNECETGRHQCSKDASCLNNQGSYVCRCNQGFSGNGYHCSPIEVCDETQCGQHAYCIEEENIPVCLCNQGYIGDGYICTPASGDNSFRDNDDYNYILPYPDNNLPYPDSQQPDPDPISGNQPYPDSNQPYPGRHQPYPENNLPYPDNNLPYPDNNQPYPGDIYYGNNDRTSVDSNYVQPGLPLPVHPGYSCSVQDGICSPFGDCVYEPSLSDFHCRCKAGYVGNGETCEPTQDILRCLHDHKCSPFATCVEENGRTTCNCFSGYVGDGHECTKDYGIDYNAWVYGTNEDGNKGINSLDNIYDTYPTFKDYESLPYNLTNALPKTLEPICIGEGRENCICENGYSLIDDVCVLDTNWKPNDGLVWPTCGNGLCTCPDGYEFFEGVYECRRIIEAPRPVPDCQLVNPALNDCVCPFGYEYHKQTNECHPNFPPGYDSTIKGGGLERESCNVLNTCHPDAQCIFDPFSNQHRCECNLGYEGDGYFCSYVEISCESYNICHSDADCVYDDKELKSVCVCKDGFKGDGTICIPQDECSSVSDCDQNAQCDYDKYSGIFKCACNEGYEGDGTTCHKIKEEGCDILRNCHQDATCREDPHQGFFCECNSGYRGNGFICEKYEVGCNILNNCGDNAMCDYDHSRGKYMCRCIENYEGDGFFCKSTLSCARDASVCHPQASCVRDYDHPVGYACQCRSGYTGDGLTCQETPEFERNILLINQGMAVLRMPASADGGYGFPIHVDTFMTAVGNDIDCLKGRYYWTDMGTSTIRSSNYDGSEKRPTVSGGMIGSPEDVAIDWVSGNLYWTDSDNDVISVASLDDRKFRRTVIKENLVNPRGIAVHPGNGQLFWSDWNRKAPKIEVSGLDGSNRRVLVEGQDIVLPNSLVVDYYTQNLCWVDAGSHRIECVGIEGYNRRVVVNGAKYPFGFTLFEDRFFYTDWNDTKIHEVDKYSGDELSSRMAPPGGAGKLYDIVVVPPRCPSVSNVCQTNRGNCPDTHMCLPNGRGGRTCACPTLENSGEECEDFVY